ncbi:MAG: multiprotein bridging factor aMBF1 [Methanomicrobiales archaeon]|nr:multiprotein bridging factor aMBF1 [Methanomicrobiales archaeon]
MQCELCGADIKGYPKTVRIEGAELQVCMQCAKYGKEVQQPRRPVAKPSSEPGKRTASPPPRPRRDLFDRIQGDIIEGYNTAVRNARMAKGWTQKDLALAMKERELLVKKIEKGDLIPEESVRVKLEKILGISLIDAPPDDTKVKRRGQVATTLGDLISLKKSEK